MGAQDLGTTTVITPACMVCGQTSQMDVDTRSLVRWNGGFKIQDAFPDLSAPEREQLKTGTHEACWNTMFADLDDDEL